MFLNDYKYSDNEGWDYSQVSFGKINLFVGPSGAGKSRLLNTIFNIATYVTTNKEPRTGNWDIKFETDDKTYRWQFKGANEANKFFVAYETLTKINKDGTSQLIFDRNPKAFTFGDKELPKLPKDSTGLFLLKDEEQVFSAHKAFSRIIRRNFFGDELIKATSMANLPEQFMSKKEGWKDRWEEMAPDIPLNIRLFILAESYKSIFDLIVSEFRSVFPSILNVQLSDGSKIYNRIDSGKMPLLLFTEKNVAAPYHLHEMSSGMQKVFLIITDVLSMRKNSLYLIDEYENSLGINAINFLPSFLAEHGENTQFVITSHHPYLINNIPVTDWSLFYREGSSVHVKNGKELNEKYGASKQEAFIKLINDPEYQGTRL